MACAVLAMLGHAFEVSAVDVSSLEQVVHDWSVRPFVEMKTMTEPCHVNGYEDVFERIWGGTENGCKVGNSIAIADTVDAKGRHHAV